MNPVQIVLIEDNPGDVFLFEMALKENGIPCQLTRFDSGADALLVLCAPEKANAFVPDAILLDLNTPRSDGFQVLIKLKQFPVCRTCPLLSSRPRRRVVTGTAPVFRTSVSS